MYYAIHTSARTLFPAKLMSPVELADWRGVVEQFLPGILLILGVFLFDVFISDTQFKRIGKRIVTARLEDLLVDL